MGHCTEDFTDSSYAVKFSRGYISEATVLFLDGLCLLVEWALLNFAGQIAEFILSVDEYRQHTLD